MYLGSPYHQVAITNIHTNIFIGTTTDVQSGSERSSYSLKECPAYGNVSEGDATIERGQSGSERSSYSLKECPAYGNLSEGDATIEGGQSGSERSSYSPKECPANGNASEATAARVGQSEKSSYNLKDSTASDTPSADTIPGGPSEDASG